MGQLTNVFRFLDRAHKQSALKNTRWATDQTHFYIVATLLINITKQTHLIPDEYVTKLVRLDKMLSGKDLDGIHTDVVTKMREYLQLSEKQTTDASKRVSRVKLLQELLEAL